MQDAVDLRDQYNSSMRRASPCREEVIRGPLPNIAFQSQKLTNKCTSTAIQMNQNAILVFFIDSQFIKTQNHVKAKTMTRKEHITSLAIQLYALKE